jgi:hypothetical protein
MIWPVEKQGGVYYVAANIQGVYSDETEGELIVRITVDTEAREHEIVYTGMFYSQLDSSCLGLTLTAVTEIMPEELGQPKHAAAALKFKTDCNADERFLRQMIDRGNRLYLHYTEDGGEYIVLAKRMKFGFDLSYL